MRSMTRFLVSLLLWTIWTGQLPSTFIWSTTEVGAKAGSSTVIPLSFHAADPVALPMEKPQQAWLAAQTYRFVHDFGADPVTVHLYLDATDKPVASADVYAFVELGGTMYSAGLASAYGLRDLEVGTRQVRHGSNLQTLLQITGPLGASYAETKFISITGDRTGIPQLLLATGLIEAKATDPDGDVMFASTTGAIPATVWAIRYRDGRLQQADVVLSIADTVSKVHTEAGKNGSAFLENRDGKPLIRYEASLPNAPALMLFYQYEKGALQWMDESMSRLD